MESGIPAYQHFLEPVCIRAERKNFNQVPCRINFATGFTPGYTSNGATGHSTAFNALRSGRISGLFQGENAVLEQYKQALAHHVLDEIESLSFDTRNMGYVLTHLGNSLHGSQLEHLLEQVMRAVPGSEAVEVARLLGEKMVARGEPDRVNRLVERHKARRSVVSGAFIGAVSEILSILLISA